MPLQLKTAIVGAGHARDSRRINRGHGSLLQQDSAVAWPCNAIIMGCGWREMPLQLKTAIVGAGHVRDSRCINRGHGPLLQQNSAVA